MSEVDFVISFLGVFLITTCRIAGEYIVEVKDVEVESDFGFGSNNNKTVYLNYRKIFILSTFLTILYGVGWDLFLMYDTDKFSLVGIAIPIVTALAQFQEITSFFQDPFCFTVLFQILIWVSWIVYVALKDEHLVARSFGIVIIFISNVYYNLVREKENIYQIIFGKYTISTPFHFAFHLQFFGYALLAISNNI